MSHRSVRLGLAIVIVSVLALSSCGLAQQAPQIIMIIGWDGAQRDHVKEMIGRNELPNLVALSNEGKLVDIDVTIGATDTKAGWTQILTGHDPNDTGVWSNGRYQPIPVGMTVPERLEAFFGADNIYTACIVGKGSHVDANAPQKIPYDEWLKAQEKAKAANKAAKGIAGALPGQVVEENGQKFVIVAGKPYYNMSQRIDMWVNGLGQNEKVGQLALETIEKNKDKRCFYFIHFAEPDHAGHAHGENSQEYTEAIKSDDEWTGKIIGKLKELGLYDKTLIYVAVDHGFDEGKNGHGNAPYVFLGTNDKLVTRTYGDRLDIAPTVLKRFGVDVKAIQPAVDGIPLDEPAPERKAPAKPNVTPQGAAGGAAATGVGKQGKQGGAKAGKGGGKAGKGAGQ